MTTQSLQRALDIALSAVAETQGELKKHFGDVEALTKGSGDSVAGVVTDLDRQTERALAKKLATFSKSVGFRGEEFGIESAADTTWLVDPIDGTAHFVRGLPFCTTMIALIEDGEVVVAVIDDFVRGDTYWAVRGSGAFCNGRQIVVSQRSLGQSFLSFETRLEKPENYAKYVAVRERAGIISTLNCGFEFAMMASGKLDGRIGLDPYGLDWDFAPGSLLVSEGGGVATNIGLSSYHYKNHDYIISNQAVHRALTQGEGALFPLL